MCKTTDLQQDLTRCKVAFATERLELMRVTEDAKAMARRLAILECELDASELEIVAKYVDSE